MKRREFVRNAAAATSVTWLTGVALAPGLVRAAACSQRAGIQLFTVRDLLRDDARAALASLREIGFEELELFGLDGVGEAGLFGMRLPDLKRAADGHGLRFPSSHVGGTLGNTAATAEAAAALGIDTVIVALPTEFSEVRDGRSTMVPARSVEQLDRLAERLNRAGREFRERDLRFGYHNHHVELVPIDGIVPFDYLMENTDPDLVAIELDLGWLAVAGVDAETYLRRYAGRVVACHLKDYAPPPDGSATKPIQAYLVEPGAGTIDFRRALAAMDETGVAHGFVEIDVSDDPLRAVERGHRHLQSLRDC
jgi:sugar phosphate isomerase/epimerase